MFASPQPVDVLRPAPRRTAGSGIRRRLGEVLRHPLLYCGGALFLYVVVALRQPPAAAALAALYVIAATLPLPCLFATAEERTQISVWVIYAVFGMCLPGFCGLLAAALHQPLTTGVVAYAAVTYGTWAITGTRHVEDAGVPGQPAASRAGTTAAAVLSVIATAPTLVYAVYMGRGAYPAMFFNSDNVYHLTHVWSLLRDGTYPVMSLATWGERRVYQYGAQAAAAMLSRVSGLPPHATFLGLLFPAFQIGIVAATWQVARGFSGRLPVWVAVGVLATFSRFPVDARELDAGYRVLTGSSLAGLGNLFSIDHIPTHFGVFAALLLLAWVAAGGERRWRAAALTATAMLPMFKMAFFLGVGAALAAYLAWVGIDRRTPRALIPGILTLGAALILSRVFDLTSDVTAGTLVLSPLVELHDLLGPIVLKVHDAWREPTVHATAYRLWMVCVEYLRGFHWLVLAVVVAAAGAVRARRRDIVPWLALVLGPVVLMNVVKYTRGSMDTEAIRSSIDTTFTLVPYLTVTAALAIAASASGANGRHRRVMVVVFGLYITYFAAVQASGTIALTSAPSVGYEYADNRTIADALMRIPTADSLIVTNDTHYRSADDLLLPVPATFGHHAYFVDGVNDKFDDGGGRRARQRRLRSDTWDPAVMRLAHADGWTHFLVRLDAPHPRDLPLALVYRNDDYAVYRFP